MKKSYLWVAFCAAGVLAMGCGGMEPAEEELGQAEAAVKASASLLSVIVGIGGGTTTQNPDGSVDVSNETITFTVDDQNGDLLDGTATLNHNSSTLNGDGTGWGTMLLEVNAGTFEGDYSGVFSNNGGQFAGDWGADSATAPRNQHIKKGTFSNGATGSPFVFILDGKHTYPASL